MSPYDAAIVVGGQGTCGYESYQQLPELDALCLRDWEIGYQFGGLVEVSQLRCGSLWPGADDEPGVIPSSTAAQILTSERAFEAGFYRMIPLLLGAFGYCFRVKDAGVVGQHVYLAKSGLGLFNSVTSTGALTHVGTDKQALPPLSVISLSTCSPRSDLRSVIASAAPSPANRHPSFHQ